MSDLVEIAQLITAVATLIVAISGFVVAVKRIDVVHKSTNSRMDEMLEIVGDARYAKGRKDEKDGEADG